MTPATSYDPGPRGHLGTELLLSFVEQALIEAVLDEQARSKLLQEAEAALTIAESRVLRCGQPLCSELKAICFFGLSFSGKAEGASAPEKLEALLDVVRSASELVRRDLHARL